MIQDNRGIYVGTPFKISLQMYALCDFENRVTVNLTAVSIPAVGYS